MRAGTEYDRKGRTGRVVALHGTGDVVEWKELVFCGIMTAMHQGLENAGAFSAEN